MVDDKGKIVSHDPIRDNLSFKAMAKNQAINQGEWEKYENMEKTTFREKNLKIRDVLSPGDN